MIFHILIPKPPGVLECLDLFNPKPWNFISAGADAECQKIQKALLRHSERVLQDGYFIELVDLLIFCKHLQVMPVFYFNTENVIEEARPANEYLNNILGPQFAGMQFWPPTQATWAIAVTRSDFAPSNHPAAWNHWAVCWGSKSLSLAERLQTLQNEADERSAHYLKLVQSADAEDEAVVDSLLEQKQQECETIFNLQKFTRRLHLISKLFPCNVLGDGNCGLWALLSLLNPDRSEELLKKPSTALAYNHTEMKSLRQTLSTLWSTVARSLDSAENQAWARMFQVFASDIANPDADCGETGVQRPGDADCGETGEPGEIGEQRPGDADCGDTGEQRPGDCGDPPDLPSTPRKESDPNALRQLFVNFTPPRVAPAARRLPAAGILRERISHGPSLPVSKVLSGQAEQAPAQNASKATKIKQEPGEVTVKQEVQVKEEQMELVAVKEEVNSVPWIKTMGLRMLR